MLETEYSKLLQIDNKLYSKNVIPVIIRNELNNKIELINNFVDNKGYKLYLNFNSDFFNAKKLEDIITKINFSIEKMKSNIVIIRNEIADYSNQLKEIRQQDYSEVKYNELKRGISSIIVLLDDYRIKRNKNQSKSNSLENDIIQLEEELKNELIVKDKVEKEIFDFENLKTKYQEYLKANLSIDKVTIKMDSIKSSINILENKNLDISKENQFLFNKINNYKIKIGNNNIKLIDFSEYKVVEIDDIQLEPLFTKYSAYKSKLSEDRDELESKLILVKTKYEEKKEYYKSNLEDFNIKEDEVKNSIFDQQILNQLNKDIRQLKNEVKV
jgi:hypothetical protein